MIDKNKIPLDVEEWKEILESQGFDPRKVKAARSRLLMSQWVTDRIVVADVLNAIKRAKVTNGGYLPPWPMYLRHMVKKRKRAARKKTPHWKLLGFASFEDWSEHTDTHQMDAIQQREEYQDKSIGIKKLSWMNADDKQ